MVDPGRGVSVLVRVGVVAVTAVGGDWDGGARHKPATFSHRHWMKFSRLLGWSWWQRSTLSVRSSVASSDAILRSCCSAAPLLTRGCRAEGRRTDREAEGERSVTRPTTATADTRLAARGPPAAYSRLQCDGRRQLRAVSSGAGRWRPLVCCTLHRAETSCRARRVQPSRPAGARAQRGAAPGSHTDWTGREDGDLTACAIWNGTALESLWN